MNSIGRLIESIALELDSTTFFIPTQCADILTGLGTIRGLWRWYDKTQLYTGNPMKIAGGTISNIALGYYAETSTTAAMGATILRVAAHFALVASRISDVVEKKRELVRAYANWQHALKGTYYVSLNTQNDAGIVDFSISNGRLISPSTVESINLKAKSSAFWLHNVTKCTFELLGVTFSFSMRFMDAVEAFSSSPRVRQDAMNEFFIHSRKAVDALANNKQVLLDRLNANREAIEKITQRVGFFWSADDLIKGVTTMLSAPENMLGGMDRLANSTLTAFKKSTYTPLSSILGAAPAFTLPTGDATNPFSAGTTH